MGLFSREEAAANSARHRVYVEQAELIRLRWQARTLQLRPDRRVLRQNVGGYLSRFRGRGIDFAEVRQYQPGDDVRTIDWRVTARRGKPHTKLFQEERERPVLIVVDQSLSQFFGSRLAFKSVRAAELASLLAWAGIQNGDRVGGLVFSDFGKEELRPARSERDVLRFLQVLTSFNRQLRLDLAQQSPRFDLNQALLELRRIAKPGSLIFVISDFLDDLETSQRHLGQLAKHNDILALALSDPLEAHLPPAGHYGISNGLQQLQIDAGDRRFQQAFEQAFVQRRQDLRERLSKAAVPLIDVSTQDDPLDLLQRALGRSRR